MLQPTEKLLLEWIRTNGENLLKENAAVDWPQAALTIPYVYLKAKNLRKDFKIPKKIQREIEEKFLVLLARNELYKHEIKNLASEFKKAKIDLVFLKGAAIFTTVYGDRDLRIMRDIDVLIRKDNLLAAEEILQKMGYLTKETKKDRQIFLKEHFHFVYYKEGTPLELHWDIGEQWHWDVVDLKQPRVEVLFKAVKKNKLNKTDIQVLSPAHSIFLACFHFERDLFLVYYKLISTPRIYLSKYASEEIQLVQNSLRFFYEIKKMIGYYKDPQIWEDLISVSGVMKKEYEIYTLLLMAEKAARVGIPPAVVGKMKRNGFVYIYAFLSRFLKDDSLNHLFVLNRQIYRLMLIHSYISKRKFYLLGMRILGGRI